MKTEIIAEVGECFNGNFSAALNMIGVAAECGCSTVKFQLLDMDEVSDDDPEYDWFSKLELTPDKIHRLIDFANSENIDILFTPVSVKTASWLHDLGQKKVKIASSFVKKYDLIEYINTHFDVVYASTGMASLEEIDILIKLLSSVKTIKLFHCISEYPTGPLLEQRGLKALDESDVHLEMMRMMKKRYSQLTIGYSDHTDGIFVPVIAVALGAEIIEKHFTLDKKTPIDHYINGLEYMGTDHVLSVEPNDLREMVCQIRRVEKIIGNEKWERSDGEKILLDFLRGRYKDR